MLRSLRVPVAAVLVTSCLLLHSATARAGTSVEIYANQQPILLGLKQQKAITLLGAVYGSSDDVNLVNGVILIAPNGPRETACPIFLSGVNTNVTVPRNTANVPLSAFVLGPADQRQVGQTLTCGLTYQAFRVVFDPGTGQFSLDPVRTKGNEVRFQYTVKRGPS
jgi:hypothetical protein